MALYLYRRKERKKSCPGYEKELIKPRCYVKTQTKSLFELEANRGDKNLDQPFYVAEMTMYL